MSAAAVLVAAGRGARAGGETPKQFLDLAGAAVLTHSIRALAAAPGVTSIVVVLPKERPESVAEMLEDPAVTSVTDGGSTRQESVGEGLICLPESAASVIVHDAARPLLRPGLVARVLAGLDGQFDGVIPVLRISEAVKEVAGDEVVAHRLRPGLMIAQTPQAFRREALEEALARAQAEGLACEDCSEMLVRAGFRVRVVQGDPRNIKLTTSDDLAVAEAILAARRVG